MAVPTAYYKALLRTRAGDTGRRAADCKSSELKCAAFVVGHYDAKGRKPSAADMMSVAELERLTGETFFANIPAAGGCRLAAAPAASAAGVRPSSWISFAERSIRGSRGP